MIYQDLFSKTQAFLFTVSLFFYILEKTDFSHKFKCQISIVST